MIPNVIYYCWFGGKKKPKIFKKCIKSWKKHCGGYRIIEINESNFDISQNSFCRQAYDAKKYAYVADFARAKTIYLNGGIYFDCDVELFKSFDSLLNNSCFIGLERKNLLEADTFGAEKGHSFLLKVLQTFENENFVKSDGTFNFHTMPNRISEVFRNNYDVDDIENKFYDFIDIKVYPTEYFQPTDFETEKVALTENTYSMHHYSASWYSGSKKFLKACSKIIPSSLRRKLRKWIGHERTD